MQIQKHVDYKENLAFPLFFSPTQFCSFPRKYLLLVTGYVSLTIANVFVYLYVSGYHAVCTFYLERIKFHTLFCEC